MKSHTVKSNAKRAARKLCEQFSGIDPAEPVAAGDGTWLPAVRVADGCLASAIAPEVAEAAVVVAIETPPCEIGVNEPVSNDDVPTEPGKFTPLPQGIPVHVIPASPPEPAPLTRDAIASVIAAPRPCSTRDEIDRRRQERRDRLATTPRQPRKPGRAPAKAEQAFALMRRSGGATTDELCSALGWQRHTLRGFISTFNSRNPGAITSSRTAGVTTYTMGGV